jgi:hypothetical protein
MLEQGKRARRQGKEIHRREGRETEEGDRARR